MLRTLAVLSEVQIGKSSRPILVTGLHRSGTTWVGKVLSQSSDVSYLHEPFSHSVWPRLLATRLASNYTYICKENAEQYYDSVSELLHYRFPLRSHIGEIQSANQAARVTREVLHSVGRRAVRRRPLVKDPMALFSIEWLVDAFEMVPVVMIRHPAAFASSLKRLNWEFPFRVWLDQDRLMRDHLDHFRPEIEAYAARRQDIIAQAALIWRAANSFVASLRVKHPDWIFLRCEDLAERPIDEFPSLFLRLGLRFDDRLAARVEAFSHRGNPKEVTATEKGSVKRDSRTAMWTWKSRLTPEEVQRVRTAVADVSPIFYSDRDWMPEE